MCSCTKNRGFIQNPKRQTTVKNGDYPFISKWYEDVHGQGLSYIPVTPVFPYYHGS